MWGCGPRSRRGQSELLGIVLLFALVLSVSLTVVVVGGDALNEAKSTTSSESADVTFRELQSKAAQSDSGDSSSQRVSFAQSGDGSDAQSAKGNAQLQGSDSVSVDPTAGSIRVEIVDDDRGTYDSGFQDLGAITYQKGDETLAYQGGGVFRQGDGSDSSVIVSAPEFEYQYQNGAPTLSMGITRLDSSTDDLSGNSFSLERTGSNRIFPISDPSASDPVQPLVGPDKVKITVESKYYRAWGGLFEERTDGKVTYLDSDGDGEDDAVKVALTGRPKSNSIENAALFTGNGKLTNDVRIDSYDSGGYGGWWDRENGDVKVKGDVELSSNLDPQVHGDLTAKGVGEFTNDPDVFGETVLGEKSGGKTVIDNGADFHSDFSSKDDVSIKSGPHTFGGDLIVGGSVTDFANSEVNGDVHIAGDIPAGTDMKDVTIHGDLIFGGSLHDPNIYHTGITIDNELSAKNTVTVNSWMDIQGNTISAGDEVLVTSGTHTNDIKSANRVVVQSGATVNGDIEANGNVHVDGTVQGSVTAGGDITGSGTITTENDNVSPDPVDSDSLLYQDLESPEEPTVGDMTSANGVIDARQADLYVDGNHDNAGSPTNDIETGGCNTGCTLESGSYSLDRINIESSDSLTLDTSSGDIEIYVHEGVIMKGDVHVAGDNQVRIYNNGANGDTYQFVMDDTDSVIHIPDDDAKQFWMYMRPGTKVKFVEGTFRGVIYGPASDTEPATALSITNDVAIYGAIIGELPTSLSSGVDIHYDESLEDVDPLNQNDEPKQDNVGYVQIMIREMMVTD